MAKTRPLHSIIRQKSQGYFFRFLNLFIKSNNSQEVIYDEIKHILVVRINYRIGNLLFVTPIIQQLQKEFPNAKVDVLIGASFAKTLFSGFSNVENIYDFPRKKLKNPIELFRYIKTLRSKKYDVILNVNYGSSSDKTATLIANSKYRVGFCQDNSFSPSTHCVKKGDGVKHASLKPLELMKAFGKTPDYNLRMDIALSDDELKEAKSKLDTLATSDKKRVAIFRNARWEKRIEDSWWLELVEILQQKDITIIDILSPDIKEPLTDDILHHQERDLRKLASFMANLDGFICADTGPMHLASASGVKTIALFNATDIDSYAPIGKEDSYIDINHISINHISQIILMRLS